MVIDLWDHIKMIQPIIDNLFLKNINYNDPGHAIDIARALDALSSDLYTDSKRFIYELLQNADDAAFGDSKNQISIDFFDDYMVFAHNGEEFSQRDIEGLCAVSHGTKKNDKTKTGYKGIGFKSVFGQSNQVIIYTAGEYFRFDKSFDFQWNNNWSSTQKEWERNNDREFIWPWQIIPIYCNKDFIPKKINEYLQKHSFKVATILKLDYIDNIKFELQELFKNLNMFIFLRNIDTLTISLDKKILIEIEHISENEINLKKDQYIISNWLLKKIDLSLDETIKTKIKNDQNIPKKLKESNSVELTLGIKKTKTGIQRINEEDNLLFSYLPTSVKSNIPVLVNSSFIMGANRQELHVDSPLNQWLFYNISYELIRWIGDLVVDEYGFQAYRLLPNKLHLANELNCEYERGKLEAINQIPILVSESDELLRIKDAIFDEVGLSKEAFIDRQIIKDFVLKRNSINITNDYNPFIKKTEFENIFLELGLIKLSWEDLSLFFSYEDFVETHTIEDNIKLIKFLKDTKKPENIRNKTLMNWRFIFDHRNILTTPIELFIPIIDDAKWREEQTISYLHENIQDYILENNNYKIWLEKLGVKEKTDIAYLEKNILPKIDKYGTEENTFIEMKRFFDMFVDGKLSDDIMDKLSNIHVLTSKNKLLKVSKCYFSNVFNPELKLEDILDKDIFLNEKYLFHNIDKDDIKRFFKKIGVKDKINLIKASAKISKQDLSSQYKISKDYFNSGDHISPYPHLPISSYSDIITIEHIDLTDKYEFSKIFWTYIIDNFQPDKISFYARGYWGYGGLGGQTSGEKVHNYVKWFINYVNCLPTQFKKCYKSTNIFLNSEYILEIAEGYLPIIDLKDISLDWKAFFNFRITLDLDDYKILYANIFLDLDDNKIKSKNMNKIQIIYEYFLNNFENWDENISKEFKIWMMNQNVSTEYLEYFGFRDIKYTDENDTSIFSDKYNFIYFNQKNKSHTSFYKFLEFLEINILTDKDFEIKKVGNPKNSSLKEQLNYILPLLINWIKHIDNFFDEKKEQLLRNRINHLEVYEYEKLETPLKNIKVYFEEQVLNLSKSWTSNTIQLELFTKLSKYLEIIGYEQKLSFLLQTETNEILEYFEEEQVSIPESFNKDIISEQHRSDKLFINSTKNEDKTEITIDTLISLGIDTEVKLLKALENQKIADEFFHNSVNSVELLTHAQKIIKRAGENILKYLNSLEEYNCEDAEFISSTIIGGIKKYGNEINIIARPSDNGIVILYYDAEFDTLENADSELWYENGKDEPKILRLGKILKDTKINRIPV